MDAVQKNKVCNRCESSKPLTEFNRNKTCKDGYQRLCKACQRVAYPENPTTKRNYQLRKKYGITLADYNHLLQKQNGCCSICNTDGGKLALAVDHCHTTGAVRGLLCGPCNRAIGLLQDSPTLISKALEYLNGKPNGDDVQPQGPEKRRSTPPLEGIHL